MHDTDKRIIEILRRDSRLSDTVIADMLDLTEHEITTRIAALQDSGVIVWFTAVIDEEALDKYSVAAIIELHISLRTGKGYEALAGEISALPETEEVRLLSGNYDLSVTIRGGNFRDIALFVSNTLAPMDGVLSTSTHFILKRFKEKNMLFPSANEDDRGLVSP
jgi:DNA-binding Lrp family transcriptional regulator